MDDDLPKPAPKIVNVRSAAALVLGLVLLFLANSGVIFSTAPHHVVEQKTLLLRVVQEVGFALIVALVIWAAWEVFKQAETEEQWNKHIDRVSRSVFFGVLKRNFPEGLVDEARQLVFEKDFVRMGSSHLFTLRDDTYQLDDGQQAACVLVEVLHRFKIKNVANEARDYLVTVGLPNPFHPGLKPKCKVLQVQIRIPGGALEDQPLGEAETKFRNALDQPDNARDHFFFDVKTIKIQSGQEIEVIWNYTVPKEEEDTEVVLFAYACEAVVISVIDMQPTKRTVRAKAIHRAMLENVSSRATPGIYSYRLDHFFLPRQGFMIWWKHEAGSALTSPQVQPGPVKKDN
ncbi:MAG: hypothetical protein QOJ84_1713 [Bradyrhizobium sp.]|jgi:hypothetical protein|nr:hypothetical protein [Bradyrhizobium sp.]